MNNVSALGKETFYSPGSGERARRLPSPGRGTRPNRLPGTGNLARGPGGGWGEGGSVREAGGGGDSFKCPEGWAGW